MAFQTFSLQLKALTFSTTQHIHNKISHQYKKIKVLKIKVLKQSCYTIHSSFL